MILWVTWHSTWFIPFTLSILPLKLVVITKLSWLQFQKLQTQRVSQPVRKKKFSPLNQAMAGPRIRRNPRRNPPPGGEDEFAGGPSGAPTKGSNTHTPSPPVSWAQTPADAQVPPPAIYSGMYTDADLQRATKLALKLFIQGQTHAQGSKSAARDKALDRFLKPRNPDLYYKSSHMECYHFCRQCKDHFETAGIKGHKCIPFAASFLWEKINFR